jgi:hypothetical protein
MKINWNQNPLKTSIELDEFEKTVFKHKVEIEELRNTIYHAIYLLKKDPGNVDKVRELLEHAEPINVELLLDALADIHCGDCICVPCACGKCLAEAYLGITTIDGLGKHEATKIKTAFSEGRDIHQAIEWLKVFDPTDPKPGTTWRDKHPDLWDSAVPRWKEEAKIAAKWLAEYKYKYFPSV